MSVSYFVRYDITALDAQRFVDRYREVHVPLLARWPGIRRVTLHTPLDWHDPFTVNRARTVLLAQLEHAVENVFKLFQFLQTPIGYQFPCLLSQGTIRLLQIAAHLYEGFFFVGAAATVAAMGLAGSRGASLIFWDWAHWS